MSLMNCPVCKCEISDRADFCPKCGHKPNKVIKCFECESVYDETLQECTNCGCPTEINIKERYKVVMDILNDVKRRSISETIDNCSQGIAGPEINTSIDGNQTKTICSNDVKYSKKEVNSWNALVMLAYVLVAIAVPFAGILIGIYGLTQKGKREQGFALSAISAIMFIQYRLFLSLLGIL